MPRTFAENCKLIEQTVRGNSESPSKGLARGALLDCLLVLLEAADELDMRNTLVTLDIVSDLAFSEVECEPVPKRTLLAILRLAEIANGVVQNSNPPVFCTRRLALPPIDGQRCKKSA